MEQVSTPTPTDPYGINTWDGLRSTTKITHPTLKDVGFYGFHFGVPVHVINLPQNLLTHVTSIPSAPKFLTEFRFGSNFFDRKPPSNILKLDRLKNIYLLHNTGISVNAPSNIRKKTGLMELDISFTPLHGTR